MLTSDDIIRVSPAKYDVHIHWSFDINFLALPHQTQTTLVTNSCRIWDYKINLRSALATVFSPTEIFSNALNLFIAEF